MTDPIDRMLDAMVFNPLTAIATAGSCIELWMQSGVGSDGHRPMGERLKQRRNI